MERLNFQIEINTDAKKVYEIMLGPATYRQWTSVFNASSYYEGNWEKGSKMYFIGLNENGRKEGMISKVLENIPNKYVSIEHQGYIEDDQEITDGENISWKGARENYIFEENNGVTTVTVELDTEQNFKEYFEKTYPEALQTLKVLAEVNNDE